MTMHESHRPDPRMARIERMIAQARPEQIERLIADIEASVEPRHQTKGGRA